MREDEKKLICINRSESCSVCRKLEREREKEKKREKILSNHD